MYYSFTFKIEGKIIYREIESGGQKMTEFLKSVMQYDIQLIKEGKQGVLFQQVLFVDKIEDTIHDITKQTLAAYNKEIIPHVWDYLVKTRCNVPF